MTWVVAQTERLRERAVEGREREIMSRIVLVILIKWKCILSSSYWFLPGAMCVFQRESLHYQAGLETLFFTHGRRDYCSQQTIELVIESNIKAELQETMYSCQTQFGSCFFLLHWHLCKQMTHDDAWERKRVAFICKGVWLHGRSLDFPFFFLVCSFCQCRYHPTHSRAARLHRSQTEKAMHFYFPSFPPLLA